MQLGDWRVGIRAADPADGELLQSALAPYVVPGGASPSFSVQFARRPGDFHLLFHGECPVIRTLDAARLLDGLLLHLTAGGTSPEGLVRLDAGAVVRGTEMTLVSRAGLDTLRAIDRRLRRSGWAVADTPTVFIDLRGRSVQLAPRAEYQAGPRDELLRRHPSQAEMLISPGSFPVGRVVLVDRWPNTTGPRSAGELVFRLSMLTSPRERLASDLLAQVQQFAEGIETVHLAAPDQAAMLAAITGSDETEA